MSQIDLAWWSSTDTPVDGYHVYRSIDSGAFEQCADIDDPYASSWSDESSLPSEALCTYRICAYTNVAESQFSNDASAVTHLPAPKRLESSPRQIHQRHQLGQRKAVVGDAESNLITVTIGPEDP